jgi:23S rRNA (cytidine1920-2'-O)/16S rRNA (cytidine1409-2'-O)-methyltransferase
VRGVRDFAPSFGYRVTGLSYSPIKGPEGNIEYLAKLEPEGAAATEVTDADVSRVVAEAHGQLD